MLKNWKKIQRTKQVMGSILKNSRLKNWTFLKIIAIEILKILSVDNLIQNKPRKTLITTYYLEPIGPCIDCILQSFV